MSGRSCKFDGINEKHPAFGRVFSFDRLERSHSIVDANPP